MSVILRYLRFIGRVLWAMIQSISFFMYVMLFLFMVTTGILGLKLFPDILIMWEEGKVLAEDIEAVDMYNKEPTVIYDDEGEVLQTLSHYHFVPVEKDALPERVKEAVIAIEDERFYEHKGYDIRGILRALVDIYRHQGEITQGGSTITQQLVKINYLSLDKTYTRKVKEIFTAIHLEKEFEKDDILTMYLNTINYGNRAYGIGSASQRYFNQSVDTLSDAQVAFLTAIPNNPSVYNPLTNMDNTLKRQKIILGKMYELGYLSKTDYQKALGEPIVLDEHNPQQPPESYLTSFALHGATKALMETQAFDFQYTFDSDEERTNYKTRYQTAYREMSDRLRQGGYTITTTLNQAKQDALQQEVNSVLSSFTAKDNTSGLYKTQGASVLIDNDTGDVKAIVGGRTQEDVANTYNRAFLSHRQPGSAIKPLLVYAPALEHGYVPESILEDKALKNGPSNWDNQFHGDLTLRYSLARSYNTIPYQLMANVGGETALDYLAQMQFSALTPQDTNPISAIGGFTYGTSPLEMASGFATLARLGEYVEPTGIQEVRDFTDTVLYENKHFSQSVYDKGVSYLTTDMLKDVVNKSYGTGYGTAIQGYETAGKTGTTTGNKDKWFVGYTPKYTLSVWVGNDKPAPVRGKSPQTIFTNYMTELHASEQPDETKFDKPTDAIRYAFVNPYTGQVSLDNNRGFWERHEIPLAYVTWLQDKQEKESVTVDKEVLKEEKEEETYENVITSRLKQYGRTEAEELAIQQQAKDALNDLQGLSVSSIEDINTATEALNKTINLIMDILYPRVQQDYLDRYNQEAERLQEAKKAVYQAIKDKDDKPTTSEGTTEEKETAPVENEGFIFPDEIKEQTLNDFINN